MTWQFLRDGTAARESAIWEEMAMGNNFGSKQEKR